MIKNLFRIACSFGISFGILALLLQVFTGMEDQQRPSVLNALQTSSLQLVLLYLLLYLVALMIRAYRYRLLLQMSGEINVPTLPQMTLVTGVRNMVVDLLPARLGELGYIGLLNRGYGVKLPHCVSSLTVSVAFDFVALIVVVAMVIGKQFLSSGVEDWALSALITAMVLAVIALWGLFIFVPKFTQWLNTQWSAITTIDTPINISKLQSFKNTSLNLLQGFNDSLVAVRQSGQTSNVLLLSIVIRLLKYSSLTVLFFAVVEPSFQSLAQLPVEKIVSALIGGEAGASLPIPTFMSFGVYEAGSVLVFQLLGVSDNASTVVTMLSVHIWSQSIEYAIGGILLTLFILLHRRANKMDYGTTVSVSVSLAKFRWAKVISFGFATIVLIVGAFFLAYQLWAASKLGSLFAPAAGQISESESEWRNLSKQNVSNINGFVVFSSNRDGNHDIFKLNLQNFKLSKLTTHPHVETYPRLSPDGKRLVFSRSQQPWVPLRNTVAWDVFVLQLDTLYETKVGSNGTAPNWISNTEISYVKEANKVIRVDLVTNEDDVLYEIGQGNSMPVDAQINNAKYNPITKQMVFTGRQNQIGMKTGHWGTAITSGVTHQGVLNGCELTWNGAGDGLFQVNPGGKFGDIRIVSVDPKTLRVDLLIDLAGQFSHEYWPKDSFNGKYMVFGASRSAKDHEHDVADYEIFLWKVGSDPSKATRLTFHTGNENWPDIFIE